MSRRLLLSTIVAAGVVGCSSSEGGTPVTEPGTSGLSPSPMDSSASPAPSSAVQESRLAVIEACELLTSEEAAALGVPPQGRPEEILGLRRCDWGDAEGGVSTAIDDELGVDELDFSDATAVTEVTIGSHLARRAVETSGPGYCSVNLAVGESSNVTVSALYLNDTPRACAAADQAAVYVEPKLP